MKHKNVYTTSAINMVLVMLLFSVFYYISKIESVIKNEKTPIGKMSTLTVTPTHKTPSITPTKTPSIVRTKTSIPVMVWQDSFSSNTTSKYQKTGKVLWQSDEQNISLGASNQPDDNKVYYPIDIDKDFIVVGKVYIPNRSYAWYESVALALDSPTDEYWATLLFGDTGQYNKNISIMKNDTWGTEYKFASSPGWYWIKISVEYSHSIIRMKVWDDQISEPQTWQVTRTFSKGWVATKVGFRHYGKGVWVDDLKIFTK
jgi:hypothetical protein